MKLASGDYTAEVRQGLRRALEPIFPIQVVESILSKENIRSEAYRDVVVLFADIVGYTELCSNLTPMSAHKLLHDFFSTLDACIAVFPKLYKVEAIGDCVMVVGGAPQHLADCTTDMIKLAILLRKAVKQLVLSPLTKQPVALRIGINTGDVVGGVVGSLMPRYTFTGDAVNVAARMQALSAPGEITLSLSTALRLARAHAASPSPSPSSSESSFTARDLEAVKQGSLELIEPEAELVLSDDLSLASRGRCFVKGKGTLQTFTLLVKQEEEDDVEVLLSKSTKRPPTVFQIDGPLGRKICTPPTPTQAVVDDVFGALSIVVLTNSVPRGKLLRNLVHKFHRSCTLRTASGYEELATELLTSGFRCDLLIFDTSDNEKVLRELKLQFPLFVNRVVSVLLSDSDADMESGEQEAARAGADDCWPMPPPAPEILKVRLLHHLLIKGNFQRLRQNQGATRGDVAGGPPHPSGQTDPPSPPHHTIGAEDGPVSLSLPPSSRTTPRSSAKLADVKESGGQVSLDALSEPLSFLVVEDSPTQRKLISHNLRQISPLWTVEACPDASSALALLRRGCSSSASPSPFSCHKPRAFDVILVDLNLGEGSLMGDALVRELRGPECDFQAPVIIGLNRSRRDTEVRFIVSGADSAWAKPLPPQDVFCRRLEVLVAARRVLAEVLE